MHMRELSQTKQALGGDVSLSVVMDLPSNETSRLFNELWKQIYSFERQFSRFLPSSELSAFNRSAGIKLTITPGFRDLLLMARELAEETEGLYNPFILPALQRAGYLNSAVKGYEDDIQEDHSSKQVVPVENLTIGDTWAQIPYGTAIDMGGCGKGYLADMIGEILRNNLVQGYWLSMSGDIATYGRDEDSKTLSVAIQNAENPEIKSNLVVECPADQFGIATSGTFRRTGQDNENDWHHIIDPSTREPAITDVRLATVCADTAVAADVLASCATILGSKRALPFLKANGASDALLQCVDNAGKIHTFGFGKNIKQIDPQAIEKEYQYVN